MKGHVRKRGNKWCFVLDVDRDPETGRRKQKWFSGFKTKKEAERAMAEKIAEINRGEYIEPARIPFRRLLKDWLEHHVKHRTSPKTFETYCYLVDFHIIPRIGEVNLDKLAPIHLQKLYSDLITSDRKNGKGKLSSTTVHHIHRICHSALKWAALMKMIPQNIAENVTPPKRNKQEIKTWNEEEVTRFLSSAQDDRLFALFFLAISTGLRRGELLGLKWGDVDFDRGILVVRRTVQRTVNGLIVK